MKTIYVEQGQTLMDISIQEYGRADDLVKLATDNGLEIDADLSAGQQILIDTDAIDKDLLDTVDYFNKNNIKVNSRNEL